MPSESKKSSATEQTPVGTKVGSSSASTELRANYLYWREHGQEWGEEYDRRKHTTAAYHIQELMLAEYMAHSAPARVLEFGCGVGRHLRYLREIDGIDVFGFDQSEAMVSCMDGWAAPDWKDQHVSIGAPIGELPYPQGNFDIVFSAEALIHVHPEDLAGILRELVRVANWQILHLEPNPDYTIYQDAHCGSWNHDLVSAYDRLGYRCETLTSGFHRQLPYRVILQSQRKVYTWGVASTKLLQRLEIDLKEGFEEKNTELRRLQESLEALEGKVTQRVEGEVRDKMARLRSRVESLEEQLREAERVQHELQQTHATKLASLEQELSKVYQRGEVLEERRDAEVEVLRRGVEDAKRALEDAQRHRGNLEILLRQRVAALDALYVERSELRGRVSELENEVERLKGRQATPVRDEERGAVESAPLEATVPRVLPPRPQPDAERHLQQLAFEMSYRKGTLTYLLARWLRNSTVYHWLRWLKSRNRSVARVHVLRRPLASEGQTVRLLAARPVANGTAILWDFVEQPGRKWRRLSDGRGAFGEVLESCSGALRIPLYGEDSVLTFLRQPTGGRVQVTYNGIRRVLDLRHGHEDPMHLYLDRKGMPVEADGPAKQAAVPIDSQAATPPVSRQATKTRLTKTSTKWLQEISTKQEPVVAVHVPRWLGVTASTMNLFDNLYPFPESADIEPYEVKDDEIDYHAAVLLDSGSRHFVFSGGDAIHHKLARRIKKKLPDARCDLLWHGSYVQFSEDYGWKLVNLWVESARQGMVHTIGTVKKGMERFFSELGCRSRFVMNFVPDVPDRASTPAPGGPHLGLWISNESYRKLPFAMLSAIKLVPGAIVHGSNFSPRTRQVIDFLKLRKSGVSDSTLPMDSLFEEMKATHLSLYVTFSECCPMIPLESLSVGVPCLTGPTSHLFEDNEYLRDRLVVPYPDRADTIADYIVRGVEERVDLVSEYIKYAPEYNTRAMRSVELFVEGD